MNYWAFVVGNMAFAKIFSFAGEFLQKFFSFCGRRFDFVRNTHFRFNGLVWQSILQVHSFHQLTLVTLVRDMRKLHFVQFPIPYEICFYFLLLLLFYNLVQRILCFSLIFLALACKWVKRISPSFSNFEKDFDPMDIIWMSSNGERFL